MLKRILILLLLPSLALAACNNETTESDIGNPTAEEILSKNNEADIFVLNGVVYSNAEDLEWVYEKELTLGKEVGEIKKQTQEGDEFENLSASKLPVGTEIYAPVEKENIYIVKVNDKEIRYLGLREG
ncbi:hypothetical protein N780_15695 [Pontibacillus chungwhensis BH030062]|uniref:Lipoprotein n=1 Tax=Pontibacillus chungwhensis BH030062 TaxID=1385513 RepID=A0A0A2VDS4_9BACI|nr:hypothetical protein [Pontibacillus chungwhensis]KGP91815.1 hypothetical protein N780_15695 [Pontibacillus chungwhensis BH030062]